MGFTPGVEADLGWALGAITRSYLLAVREAVSDVPGGVRGYLVLAAAGQGEPKSQLALAQHLGVDRTAMTYLLDGLEDAGFVERRPDPADRRARRVLLTTSGQARLTALQAGMHQVEGDLLAPLDADERTVLRVLLQRLATTLAPANPCDATPCEMAAELVGGRSGRERATASALLAALSSGRVLDGAIRPAATTPYRDDVPLTGGVALTVVAALLVAVGLVGVLVPALPGLLLVLGGITLWALPRGDAMGWTVLGAAVAIVALGTLLKYLLPGARMRAAGVPGRTLLAGGVLGVVGFFVVPVVGLVLGFVLGVYLAERARLGVDGAGPSTRTALAAVGWSVLIELAAGLLAAAMWVGALVLE